MVRRRRTEHLKESVRQLSPSRTVHSMQAETKCFRCVLTAGICLVVMVYFLVPTMLILMPQISEQVLYMNYFVSDEEVQSLKQPATKHHLKSTASFLVDCDGLKLGVWHILPKDVVNGYDNDSVLPAKAVQNQLRNSKKVIIYHHGSGSTRATGDHLQRREMYKIFQSEGYHTIAFDYRGFGDSTGWPSEPGVVNDSLCIYHWIKRSVSRTSKIFFWGHSMGGAVATLAAKRIFDSCVDRASSCSEIDGLILEGTLMNVREGAKDNRIVRVVKTAYPESLFDYLIDISMGDTTLSTDTNLHKVLCPVLLLHAEDDDIIPITHGTGLFQIYMEKMEHSDRKVKFVKFKAQHGYGHMDLYKAPELPLIVKEFVYSGGMDNQVEEY